MDLKPIKTEADYRQALAQIEQLFEAELNTPEEDHLEILTALVEDYEEKHHPIDLPLITRSRLIPPNPPLKGGETIDRAKTVLKFFKLASREL
jgi:hypothetical protein